MIGTHTGPVGLQRLQTFADLLDSTQAATQDPTYMQRRTNYTNQAGRGTRGMRRICGAMALWAAAAMVIESVGPRDSVSALFVTLTLASAFHDRDNIRTAARRALMQFARSASVILGIARQAENDETESVDI
jgi:hypothetical protein